MILLIDAFNLIYKFPELEEAMYRDDLTAAMNGIKRLLASYKAARGNQDTVHVFFDGKRKSGDETRRLQEQGLHLYYSQDLSADHLIMEFIKRSPSPGEIWVVSTDKKVYDFARKHKCHRYKSEEFAELLLKEISEEPDLLPDKPEAKLSKSEIAEWEAMFRDRKPE